MTFVDTNVLLDLVTKDPVWVSWSLRQLEAASLRGSIVVNDVVYAELSVGFRQQVDVDHTLATAGAIQEPIPRPALFLAGKVYQRYRAAGGTRTGVLPDFFIGAHASVAARPLLTRDPRRYQTYFPGLNLISP